MAIKRDVAAELASDSQAKFMVVEFSSGTMRAVYDGAGELLTFVDAALATRRAEELTARDSVKHTIRPVNDDAWRSRETKRLQDGTYVPLPWQDQKWWAELGDKHKDHFPHASLGKIAMVAFTETERKGSADIQTLIKPGKYLERFFGEPGVLNSYVIRDLVSVFSNKFESNRLLWAETEEEIVDTFVNGPQSCMSKPASSYPTDKTHPCAVYAGGDIQIAYLMREGRVVARTVAYPAKKLYNTIYGDAARLEPLLKKEGYRCGPPIGAKIRRVVVSREDRFAFVVPHVDNAGPFKDDGEFLTIVSSGKDEDNIVQAAGGSGVSELIGFMCRKCKGDMFTKRQMKMVGMSPTSITQSMWCTKCAKTDTFQCAETGVMFSKEVGVPVIYGNTAQPQLVWIREAGVKAKVCKGTGRLYAMSYMTEQDGDWYSKSYLSKNKSTPPPGSKHAGSSNSATAWDRYR